MTNWPIHPSGRWSFTDSRFVNYRFSFRNFADYRFWAHFASKGFPIRFVQIVSQITVSPCYKSERKKELLNDDKKLATLGQAAYERRTKRSGKLQRLCIQVSKTLGTSNFSFNSFCWLQQRQLVGSASFCSFPDQSQRNRSWSHAISGIECDFRLDDWWTVGQADWRTGGGILYQQLVHFMIHTRHISRISQNGG